MKLQLLGHADDAKSRRVHAELVGWLWHTQLPIERIHFAFTLILCACAATMAAFPFPLCSYLTPRCMQ